MRAHVRVHGDDGDVLDDIRDIVQAIVDEVPDTIQKPFLIFFNALLLFESDE